jgi:L-seryl-tRNA(Ser) seleniumtransferase
MIPQKIHQKSKSVLREIPSIHDILKDSDLQKSDIDDRYLKQIVDVSVQQMRQKIRTGKITGSVDRTKLQSQIVKEVLAQVARLKGFYLKRVINGTGIILHTNLGRAPLADVAKRHLQHVIENYCNLELNLESGTRGDRIAIVEEIICLITEAEAAVVVNNNAAAVLLALYSLCKKKEVPVSRGELVEIGGSFRMPEVMKAGQVKMVEVGTTNKTHLDDYQDALSNRTGGILKVHTSNYRVMGFTETVEIAELVKLTRKNKLPLIYDMGSGVIENLEAWGYSPEPIARDYVKAGVDVITFSADKVLGGPQAGVIIGKAEYLKKIKQNHLLRALRCDKLTFALLDATLRLYLNPTSLKEELPVAKMMNYSKNELQNWGADLLKELIKLPLRVEIVEVASQMGSGALPLEKIPSVALKIKPLSVSINTFAKKLRENDPAILGRISGDSLYLDLRTIQKDEGPSIVKSIKKLLK